MASNYDKHIFRQLEDVLKKCDNLSQEIKDIKKVRKKNIQKEKQINFLNKNQKSIAKDMMKY